MVSRPALDRIGDRREVRLLGVRFVGRRRRPSGEPAPLPHQLHRSGWLAAVGVAVVLGSWVVLLLFPWSLAGWSVRDGVVLEWFVGLRDDSITTVARAVASLGSEWFWRPLRIGVVVVLVVLARWRHLLVGVLALFLSEFVVGTAAQLIARPRPLVAPLTGWEGYAHPSAPVASLAVTLTIIGLVLLPTGRRRTGWCAAATAMLAAVVLARVYLGVDHPSDAILAAAMGSAVPLLAFRLLASEVVCPVNRRGRGAHLAIDERRAEAIRRAMRDQLGVEVRAIDPFRLGSSGGSTPLKLTVAGRDGGEILAAVLLLLVLVPVVSANVTGRGFL